MKKFFTLIVLALLFCGLNSFYELQNRYNNIFKQLGIDEAEADSYILGNIIGGSTSFPTTKIMAQMALGRRAEATREMGRYIKDYTKTQAFKEEYQATRLGLKPEKPTDPLYQGEEDMKIYRKDLERWEAEYPASVDLFLQRKLKEFLSLTADIDFEAKLQRSGSKLIFSDPVLESKDEFWKACYRSGKPAVEAAREFARQWLKELGK